MIFPLCPRPGYSSVVSVFSRVRVLFAFAVLFGGVLALSAAESHSPFFQVTGAAPGVDALPLKSTHVEATLTGAIAAVSLTQTYRNEGDRPLEANYVFPGSTRAAVHGLILHVGARRIEAMIKEKDEARKIYEGAKKAGQRAALLAAQRSNLFEMSVANILPGDEVTVELQYTELLLPLDGEYEWVVPTTVGPRYRKGVPAEAEGTPTVSEAASPYFVPVAELEPVFTVSAEIVAGMPVTSLNCVSHNVETFSSEGRTRVELRPQDTVSMNRDFILRYRMGQGQLSTGLLVEEWKGEYYFLATVQPPPRIDPTWIPPRDFVVVVDVSGSMHGFPLETAKQFLRQLLFDLRDQDTFNVLLFSGGNQVLSKVPLPATPENLALALRLLDRQQGGGSTELLPALQSALALPRAQGIARSIIVVTDGYVDLEAEAYALVRDHIGDANLFSFGIGSAVNRELIERLARAGRAEPAVIESPAAVSGQLERFQRMIASPLLTQVRARYTGLDARSVYPGHLPDVLAQRPLIWVGKYSGESQGKIRLEGHTAQGLWQRELEIGQATRLGTGGVLAQLWARERISELEDRHALGDDRPARRLEIVETGLKYHLLTRFTSFVAVNTTPRPVNMAGPVEKVQQPHSLPEGMAAMETVPTTPEPETVALLVVAGAAAYWRLRRRKSASGQVSRATSSSSRT